MLKKEFKEMEKICKEGWRLLAKSGSSCKDDGEFQGFFCACPACEIALRTTETIQHPFYEVDCRLCPVTEWRTTAQKIAPCPEEKLAVCDYPRGTHYFWRTARDIDVRKTHARSISRLKWSWIPEYKNTALPAPLKQRLAAHTKKLHELNGM